MKRTMLTVLCLSGLIWAAPSTATASMIGDVLTITRLYPDLSTIFTLPDADGIDGVVTVAAQDGPDPGASPQPSHYLIDFQPNNIVFDFVTSSAFLAGVGPAYSLANPFDGLKFEGFSLPLLNASVADVTGIEVTELFIQNNALYVNLNGEFDPNAALNLHVQFNSVPEVPAPLTLLLIGSAFIGGTYRLMRKRAC